MEKKYILTKYVLYSGDDSLPNRLPIDWTMGANNTTTAGAWTTLHTVTSGQSAWTTIKQPVSYAISATMQDLGGFNVFRLNITSGTGGGFTQLSDWEFWGYEEL
jgi:hypothetical protein